jgi:NosR/NirI family nitrous oxide reductase transcriptional regulator
VLFVALSLAALLVLKRRSRREIFLLTVFSLVYFGYLRKGCVCSVGSLQNVLAALFDTGTGVSLTVLAFFAMPLIFALFFGRVFCAAVCPLGAIQEAVALRPLGKLGPADKALRIFPYIYLGVAVLGVATGAGFFICRYDPFVGFFRRGAGFNMLAAGGVLLLTGIFIARPYCRFLCPYGVLLGWMSRVSKWHATITPAECIQCRLCEDSCPFDAINKPTPEDAPETRRQGTRRLAILVALLPVIVLACAGTGVAMHGVLSRLHYTVTLAERVAAEDAGKFTEMTIDSETFRSGEKPVAVLYEEARAIRAAFKVGGGWLGAFIGLVVGCKLIGLSVVRKREDYEPDREGCYSCGRCYAYCPVKKKEE